MAALYGIETLTPLCLISIQHAVSSVPWEMPGASAGMFMLRRKGRETRTGEEGNTICLLAKMCKTAQTKHIYIGRRLRVTGAANRH